MLITARSGLAAGDGTNGSPQCLSACVYLSPGLYAFWRGPADAKLVEIDTREGPGRAGREPALRDTLSGRASRY
ncbi:hypothetical protein ACFL5Q_05655 [Planctomycetota bacterium]